MAELLEFIILLIGIFIAPILVAKMGSLNWIDPYLWELWTIVFIAFSVHLLTKPKIREFIKKVHVTAVARSHRGAEYFIYFIVGSSILYGYCSVS